MIEFITGIFFGYFLNWPVFVGLMLLGVIFEFNEARGMAIFTAILTGLIAFFFFNIPVETLGIYAIAYVVIGVVWSFWRYKRYVDRKIAEDFPTCTARGKEHLIERLKPTNMLDTITAWIIVWPFSMVENLTADLLTAIEELVRTVFKGVYNRIYKAAIGKLDLSELNDLNK